MQRVGGPDPDAGEKTAEVVGLSAEILMRLGTKICRMCLRLRPIPATHMGNGIFASTRLFTSLSPGHPVPVGSVLSHVSG